MAIVFFQCGHCKARTASQALHCLDVEPEEYEDANNLFPLQVLAACNACRQGSTLHYQFEVRGDESQRGSKLFWIRAITQDLPEGLADEPATQWPKLLTHAPGGLYHVAGLNRAWFEAERAFAHGRLWTAAGIAYRRVLEIGVKALDKRENGAKRLMLGQRLKALKTSGVISEELYTLANTAKAFGDEGAHATELSQDDAEIARDLCEAFLRQAFTVPYLLRSATGHIEAKAERRRNSELLQSAILGPPVVTKQADEG